MTVTVTVTGHIIRKAMVSLLRSSLTVANAILFSKSQKSFIFMKLTGFQQVAVFNVAYRFLWICLMFSGAMARSSGIR